MALGGEEIEELLADFGAFHGGRKRSVQNANFTR
jgi:hypothetical protein